MSTRRKHLTVSEIRQHFANQPSGVTPGPIVSPKELAALLKVSRKTIYQWVAQGRLDGAFRKRGKHVLIWRDRALDILFNGRDWN